MVQLLLGLRHMHTAGVLHRDLKPANLLVNSDCDLAICDFGLSRGAAREGDEDSLTDYVVTRWYRSPEVLCAARDYGPPVDVWAAGCIGVELLLRRVQ